MKRSSYSEVDVERNKGKMEKHVRFCEEVTVGKALTMSRKHVDDCESQYNCPKVSVDDNLSYSSKVCSFYQVDLYRSLPRSSI